MTPQDETRRDSSPDSNRLARILRHEVGDLLQSIYSTVGILLDRLPETLALERRLVSDLKNRAELCKLEVDAIVELAALPVLSPVSVDLMPPIHAALLQVRRRFPGLEVHFDAAVSVRVLCDPRALSAAIGVLFLAVCQSAQRQVRLRLRSDPPLVECELQRDGCGVSREQLAWLHEPFASTQQPLLGTALALTQRVATAAGGTVTADNLKEGGFSVCIRLPLAGD
jgi:signal transduction histidine kinase